MWGGISWKPSLSALHKQTFLQSKWPIISCYGIPADSDCLYCLYDLPQDCKAAGIGGNGICIHDKRKGRCLECGGSEMCRHGRRLARCFDCKGSEICEHSKIRCNCVDCGGSAICEHGKRKYDCSSCKKKKTMVSHPFVYNFQYLKLQAVGDGARLLR